MKVYNIFFGLIILTHPLNAWAEGEQQYVNNEQKHSTPTECFRELLNDTEFIDYLNKGLDANNTYSQAFSDHFEYGGLPSVWKQTAFELPPTCDSDNMGSFTSIIKKNTGFQRAFVYSSLKYVLKHCPRFLVQMADPFYNKDNADSKIGVAIACKNDSPTPQFVKFDELMRPSSSALYFDMSTLPRKTSGYFMYLMTEKEQEPGTWFTRKNAEKQENFW